MTIYEQIQRALDYVENNLFCQIKQEYVAREAGMSSRSMQHYFWMITGYSYKEYVVKRRLNAAKGDLLSSNKHVLDIALDIGYQTHESFTRAFKREFNVSPNEFRRRRLSLDGLERLGLYKEIYMGIIVKELPEMPAATFKGYGAEPETQAKKRLQEWLKAVAGGKRPRRVFGHNVDSQGNVENNPDNTGYKFYVSIDNPEEGHGADVEVIKAGRFCVTGIEGNFIDDPTGNFIRNGWARMNAMIAEKGYNLKKDGRWFEEELEPQKAGNLRLDLYVEIE